MGAWKETPFHDFFSRFGGGAKIRSKEKVRESYEGG